jgi:hypothetical protein
MLAAGLATHQCQQSQQDNVACSRQAAYRQAGIRTRVARQDLELVCAELPLAQPLFRRREAAQLQQAEQTDGKAEGRITG